MTLWLAPLLGLICYAVGVAIARTDVESMLALERRLGLPLGRWMPCPVDKQGLPRARAVYAMAGVVIAVLGSTAAASLTLLSLL